MAYGESNCHVTTKSQGCDIICDNMIGLNHENWRCYLEFSRMWPHDLRVRNIHGKWNFFLRYHIKTLRYRN